MGRPVGITMRAQAQAFIALAIACLLLTVVFLAVTPPPPPPTAGSGSANNNLSGGFTAAVARSSFPAGFIFGTASSAYQYEGAAKEGGRGPSIWDTLTHNHPDAIADGSNGDIAVDSYHRYKEDVSIIKKMGMDAYRFSISWSRILPNGKLSGGVNREGVDYYNNLINELIANGLQPFVTLFHWDLPQVLEDEYGGFLSQMIVDDFQNYAEVCFQEFGDRVKHWITLNEPWTFAIEGYPPSNPKTGQCFLWAEKCYIADMGRSPYVLVHNQLLAHAAAAAIYREKYQRKQQGKIGIALNSHWFLPYENLKSNDAAASKSLDFMFGWLMDPITRGDYPSSMRAQVANCLPEFTRRQAEMLKGSFDFLGINYYTSLYAYSSSPPGSNAQPNYWTDQWATQTAAMKNGTLIGPQAASNWLHVYPPGLRELLLHAKTKYNNPTIYITENGMDEHNNKTLSLVEDALKDDARVGYFERHLFYLQQAISEGVDVKGYFAWSLLDNFEWRSGYTVRFGMNYVDFDDGLKRYPKRSAKWFTEFLGR